MRLAGVSALLTFVILCAFAVAIGSLTVHRVRSDFNRQVHDTANQLPSQLNIKLDRQRRRAVTIDPPLGRPRARRPTTRSCASSRSAARCIAQAPANAPSLGPPGADTPRTIHGYRVVSRAGIVRDPAATSRSAR